MKTINILNNEDFCLPGGVLLFKIFEIIFVYIAGIIQNEVNFKCKTFLNAKWSPKILNLANNKILYDIFDCPEMSGFLKLDSTIWINLCGNYCMCDKKDILKIEPKLLIKLIFIPEDDLDKDNWRCNFREKTNDGEWIILYPKLEDAVLESHKKYYKAIKSISHI